jgi:hypothetical protein
MNELQTKYRRAGIIVLAKALDDICPTFAGEADEDKRTRIAERIDFFKTSEVELDNEWEVLEKEAEAELKAFIKERDTIFTKIEKTNNSQRVQQKVLGFETKKQSKVEYLARKAEREIEECKVKLLEVKRRTKKHRQLSSKILQIQKSTASKIKKTELRYNTIIKNTMNSDNAERVAHRLEQSKAVWERKYKELRDKHLVKETIHNNKRMEYDQIRIALEGFTNEVKYIKRWCTLADVTLKECYTEAIKRAKMVDRDYSGIQGVLNQVIAGEI